MQLYAYDLSGNLTFSFHALKQKNYCCTECGATVRLREGPHRQPHFYHLQEQKSCRQNGKGASHLQLQLYLKQQIPEICLEKRFSSINRIADAFWEMQKIIFEIQCSPITKEELQARIEAYHSLGYTTVWILHDKRYNQWRLSAAEAALRPIPHYFTNMDRSGKGFIYDQWSFIDKGIRKDSLEPLPIDITKPYRIKRLGFQGDILSLPDQHPYLQKIKEKESALVKPKIDIFSLIKNFISTRYTNLLKSYCE